MKIKKIIVRNFRGIDNLELRFSSHDKKLLDLVVLAGPNGCGKTSVLEACLLLLGKDSMLSRKNPTQNIRKDSDDFSISGILEHEGNDIEVERSSNMKKPLWNPPTDSNGFPCDYFSSWRYPKPAGNVSVALGKGGRKPQNTEENRLWLLKRHLINLTVSKAFPDSSGTVSVEEKEAYGKLNNIWKYFYPSRNERFAAMRAGRDISEGFELFLEGRSESPIAVDDLSSGEIEILTLFGQSLRNPLGGGILFIDEPELHLHPSWHRAILRAFAEIFSNAQIVCATHSQEVLDSVYSYRRFTLLSENDPRVRSDSIRTGNLLG